MAGKGRKNSKDEIGLWKLFLMETRVCWYILWLFDIKRLLYYWGKQVFSDVPAPSVFIVFDFGLLDFVGVFWSNQFRFEGFPLQNEIESQFLRRGLFFFCWRCRMNV